MILYPTETIYALGVNPLLPDAAEQLEALKGDRSGKYASWLVRDVGDIARYAVVSETAAKIAEQFLPGPLTLVLPALDSVMASCLPDDRTIGFRISPDPVAQQVIADFMAQHNAPLTCTSANISGQPSLPIPTEILAQFTESGRDISRLEVVDDGPRTGQQSTVVRVIGNQIDMIRVGAVLESDIRAVI